MNEVAWCYLEGFGTKKDKVSRLPSRLALPCLASCPSPLGTPLPLGNSSPSYPADGEERPGPTGPLLNPNGTAVAVGLGINARRRRITAPPTHLIRLTDAQHTNNSTQQQSTTAWPRRTATKSSETPGEQPKPSFSLFCSSYPLLPLPRVRPPAWRVGLQQAAAAAYCG